MVLLRRFGSYDLLVPPKKKNGELVEERPLAVATSLWSNNNGEIGDSRLISHIF